jgi:hypothetical protein
MKKQTDLVWKHTQKTTGSIIGRTRITAKGISMDNNKDY